MNHRSRMTTVAMGGCALAALGLGAAVALWGCSNTARSRVMHFFFEYPQEEKQAAGQSRAEDKEEKEGEVVPKVASEALIIPPRFGSRHPPFVQRNCQACHRRNLSQAPTTDLASACQNCHAAKFASHRFSHPPAAEDCLTCHLMHTSRNEALLTAPQPDLCFDCHDPDDDEMEGEYHDNMDTVKCTTCHNPHFSDRPALLKPQRLQPKRGPVPDRHQGRAPGEGRRRGVVVPPSENRAIVERMP